MGKIIEVNEGFIKNELNELVCGSVEHQMGTELFLLRLIAAISEKSGSVLASLTRHGVGGPVS